MTAKEWLDIIKQAKDYNHALTNLIEKYGEILLQEKGYEAGYSQGYIDAQREAAKEIREHYHLNNQ